MTILVAGGDSFVWGSELSDEIPSEHPSQHTFTSLLAKNNNLNYDCCAWAGNANNAISRDVINKCQQLKHHDKVVVVCWTFSSRYEFYFSYSTRQKRSPWYSITPWTMLDTANDIIDNVLSKSDPLKYAHLLNLSNAKFTGVFDFAKSFYKHVGDSEYFEIYSTFKEILFLQNYLKVNNIPYMFVTADWQEEALHRNLDETVQSLNEQIDWNNWYFFPPGDCNNPEHTTSKRGFYQWAVENKYKIGVTHPLEDAHYDASILLQEKFNEMVKKFI